MFSSGDRVAVLHDTIKGHVVNVCSNTIEIEDEDGFIRSYPPNKLVALKKENYRISDTITPKDTVQTKSVKGKQIKQKNTQKKKEEPFEIDLHIEELRDSVKHLTNYEIVQIQMTTCRAFVQNAIAVNKKRIVLIHGKGQGVLKSEIYHYLERLIDNNAIQLDYHDASFRDYGIGGATEVLFYTNSLH